MDSMDTTYGAALVGLMVSAVLYGVTIIQSYTYFLTYPNDTLALKLMISCLWVLDTLHLILSTNAIYWYLVTNFGDSANLVITHWSMNIQTDCNGLIGLIVELFFAQRVWRVSRSVYLTTFVVILSFIHFGLGIYFSVEGFVLRDFTKYNKLTWVTVTGLGSAAVADITIAASLVFYLRRSRTGFKRTDSLITKLVVYAINTGTLTSICATIAVICFAIMPTNFVWLSFFWCLGKLYVNSLLALLNGREALRGRVSEDDGLTSVHLSNMRHDRSPASPPFSGRISQNDAALPIRIVVETTKMQTADYYSAHGSRGAGDKDDERTSSIISDDGSKVQNPHELPGYSIQSPASRKSLKSNPGD